MRLLLNTTRGCTCTITTMTTTSSTATAHYYYYYYYYYYYRYSYSYTLLLPLPLLPTTATTITVTTPLMSILTQSTADILLAGGWHVPKVDRLSRGLESGKTPVDMRCNNGRVQMGDLSPQRASVDAFLNHVYENIATWQTSFSKPTQT